MIQFTKTVRFYREYPLKRAQPPPNLNYINYFLFITHHGHPRCIILALPRGFEFFEKSLLKKKKARNIYEEKNNKNAKIYFDSKIAIVIMAATPA